MKKLGLVALILVLQSAVGAAATEPERDLPQCRTIKGFGAGLASAFYQYGRAIYAVGTTFSPDGGFRVDDDEQVYFTLSWPLQLTFGPESGRQELEFGECAENYVERFRPSRVVVEPIMSGTLREGELELGFDTRGAYRFLWHEADSDWGVGLGMGSTIQWIDGVRASVSPELLVQYGECCVPSYLTVSLRYDRFFAGDVFNLFAVSLGWSFW